MLGACCIRLLRHVHHEIRESLIQWVLFCDVGIGTVLSCPGVDVCIVVTVRADHQWRCTTWQTWWKAKILSKSIGMLDFQRLFHVIAWPCITAAQFEGPLTVNVARVLSLTVYGKSHTRNALGSPPSNLSTALPFWGWPGENHEHDRERSHIGSPVSRVKGFHAGPSRLGTGLKQPWNQTRTPIHIGFRSCTRLVSCLPTHLRPTMQWSLRWAASQRLPDADSSVVGLQTRGNRSWDRCEKTYTEGSFLKASLYKDWMAPQHLDGKNSISIDSIMQISWRASKQGREIAQTP